MNKKSLLVVVLICSLVISSFTSISLLGESRKNNTRISSANLTNLRLLKYDIASAKYQKISLYTESKDKNMVIRATPDIESTLSTVILGPPDSLNPVATSSKYDWEILSLIFLPLMIPNPDNYFDPRYDIPLVLEKPPEIESSPDGYLILTLKLRENITFFDGTKLTAEDLKFTLDFINWLGIDNDPWYDIYTIYNKSEIIDNYTIKVYLNVKGIAGAWLLMNLVVFPKHIYEKAETWNPSKSGIFPNWTVTHNDVMGYEVLSADDPILTGYGPYKLMYIQLSGSSLSSAEFLILERNPDYFFRAVDENENIVVPPQENDYVHGPYHRYLVFYVIDDIGEIVDGILNGDLDVAADMDFYEYYDQFRNKPGINYTTSLRMGFGHLFLNTRYSVFKYAEFRRALAYAIDKYVICQEAWNGWAIPLDSIVGRAKEFWSIDNDEDKPIEYYRSNISAALAELEKIGIKDYDGDGWLETNESDPNSEITFTIEGVNTSSVIEILSLVGHYLELLGLHIEYRFVDFSTLLNDLFASKFNITFFGYSLSRLPFELEGFASWGIYSLLGNWENSTYDDLVYNSLYQAQNWDNVIYLAKDAQIIFLYEQPDIPLYENYIIGLLNETLHGAVVIPGAPYANWYTYVRSYRMIYGLKFVDPSDKVYINTDMYTVSLQLVVDYLDNLTLLVNNSPVAVWYRYNVSNVVKSTIRFGSEGTYMLEAIAYYNDTTVESASAMIIVDWTAPRLDVDSTLNGSWISGSIMIPINATDNILLSEIKVSLVEAIKDITIYANSNTFEGNVVIDVSDLNDGQYTISIKAIDMAGNTIESILIINIDNNAPIINVESPENNSVVNTDIVTISWSAYDFSGISNYTLNLDNGSRIVELSGTTTSFTFTNLADGYHTVILTATDKMGQKTRVAIVFAVDTQPPNVSIIDPTNGAVLNSTFILNWTASDNLGIERIGIFVNDSLYLSVNGNASSAKIILSPGNYTIKIIATDYAGFSSTSYVNITIEDNFWIKITSPSNNTFVSDGNITITIEYGNYTNIDNITVRIINSANTSTIVYSGNNISSSPFSADISLMNGTNEIIVEMWGVNGSYTEYRILVILDNLAPISIIKVSNSYVDNYAEFQVNVSDEYLDYFEIYINGTLWYRGSRIGLYTFTWMTSSVSEGVYNITLIAIDKAGNKASTTSFVHVDHTSPIVLLSEPNNNTMLNSGTTSIIASIYDNVSKIRKIYIYIDNEIESIIDVNAANYTLNISLKLSEGTHDILIIVDNIVFLGSRILVRVTIDFNAPVVIMSIRNGSYFNRTYLNLSWFAIDYVSGLDYITLSIDNESWIKVVYEGYLYLQDLSEGNHTVEVNVRDLAGNEMYVKYIFYVDLTPPMISVENGDEIATTKPKITIIVDVYDNFELAIAYMVMPDFGLRLEFRDRLEYTLSLPEVGVYMVYIEATDRAGNTYVKTVNIYYDTAVAEIQVYSPTATWLSNEVNITFYIEDQIYRKVQVFVNGTLYYESSEVGLHTIILDTSNYTYAYLIILINVSDYTGYTFVKEITVFIDNEPPTILLEVTNNSWVSEFTIPYFATDKYSGISSISVYLNGSLLAKYMEPIGYITAVIDDGTYVLSIRAYDKTGNVKEVSILIHKDSTAPTLEVIAPKNNTSISTNKVTIRWQAEDNYGIKYFLVIIGNATYNTTSNSIDVWLSEGKHTIIIEAVDYAGNIARSTLEISVTTGALGVGISEIVLIVVLVIAVVASALAALYALRRKRLSTGEEY